MHIHVYKYYNIYQVKKLLLIVMLKTHTDIRHNILSFKSPVVSSKTSKSTLNLIKMVVLKRGFHS